MSRELELITAAVAADGRPGPVAASPGDGPKHAVLHTECLNCGHTLHGRFCAHCGQPTDDHHRSVLHLAWEALEGFTHLDGRLAKTLPALFLRPGSLARDHFEGRRQRHVPPFRLFLISLLLFMLALELLVHRGSADVAALRVQRDAPARHGVHVSTHVGAPGRPDAAPAPTAAPATVTPGLAAPREPEAPQLAGVDRPGSSTRPSTEPGGSTEEDAVAEAAARGDVLGALGHTHAAANSPLARWALERAKAAGVSPEYFESVVFEWAHRSAVLLLPIFALLLTLCYCYRRRFYVYDHLIVSMQFLSFIFLVSAVAWVLPKPLRAVAVPLATLWTPVNLFMILRGAYGSSLAGAVLKALALWVSALVLFSLLLVGVVVVALGQMH